MGAQTAKIKIDVNKSRVKENNYCSISAMSWSVKKMLITWPSYMQSSWDLAWIDCAWKRAGFPYNSEFWMLKKVLTHKKPYIENGILFAFSARPVLGYGKFNTQICNQWPAQHGHAIGGRGSPDKEWCVSRKTIGYLSFERYRISLVSSQGLLFFSSY